jgi:hypothetical protein
MSAAEVYQAGRIKRTRRTNAQVAQLEDQIVDVLRADHPQSVRHVFYRMTDPRLPVSVEKTESGYEQVQNRLVKMRRDGKVPYGWITDATRRGFFVNTFGDAGNFIQRISGLYRSELWERTDNYVEVWCESRSIAGVIQGVCTELAVPLYPSGGFTSLTLAFQAAEHINAVYDEREVTILYIGDYDPAGVLIDVSIERELRGHLDEDVSLSFERIGITEEQINELDLPTKPRKKGDKRAVHIERTVEAEAMPAGTMRELLRAGIEALLPPRALEVAKEAERSERAVLAGLVNLARGDAR